MYNHSEVTWRTGILIHSALSFVVGAVVGFIWGCILWNLFWIPYVGFEFAPATPYIATVIALISGFHANGWYRTYWNLQELKRQHRLVYLEYIRLNAFEPKEPHTVQDKLWCITGCLAHLVVPAAIIIVVNVVMAILNRIIPGIAFLMLIIAPYLFLWVTISLTWGGWNLQTLEDEIKNKYQVPEWFREDYRDSQ